MSEHPFECLSAFLDGEPVDPSEMAETLAMPGAREALVDFIRLRAEFGQDSSEPSAKFYGSMERIFNPESRRTRSYVIGGGLALAAAVILFAVFVWVGPMGRRSTGGDYAAASLKPPTPTRDIRFEPGVDWESKSASSNGEWR